MSQIVRPPSNSSKFILGRSKGDDFWFEKDPRYFCPVSIRVPLYDDEEGEDDEDEDEDEDVHHQQ